MKNNDYTKKLENIIKQMIQPLKNLPISLVIENLSGCKIIPFNKNDSKDVKLLENLKRVAQKTGETINKTGIEKSRPNEVGNDIESFVKETLNSIGYKASCPKTKSGKNKSTGYPDLCFTDEYNRINYLECKTFNIDNLNTTFRSFYLSPSEDFKITKDAHHFIISYEIIVSITKSTNSVYKCKSWKIITLDDLDVDVKYEFNSDNARLYAKKLILAEGTF